MVFGKLKSKKGELISMKNVIAVFTILFMILGALIGYYAFQNVGGMVLGTISSVSKTSNLNLSDDMRSYLNETEHGYINANKSLNSNVTLSLSVLSIVIILVLFGMTGLLGYNFLNRDKKKTKGGLSR